MTKNDIRGLTKDSTADDVLAGIDLTGKRAVVTGAASGIGVETARSLARAGADVTIAVRNTTKGREVAADIEATTGRAVTVSELHLDEIASVHAFVTAWSGPLHILVNNAGIMDSPLAYTSAGWESQLATNHLGHFALATGLHEALVEAGSARVVAVSSSGHGSSPFHFEDPFFVRREYTPNLGYGQSKTANVLFAVEAQRRWGAEGITANALMPGGIWTGLQKHWDPEVLATLKRDAVDVVKTTEQGASTSVLLATAPELEGYGGRYFEDNREAQVVPEIYDVVYGVVPWAVDPEAASRLWDVSTALVDAELVRLGLTTSR
ncbi:SDR family NAD(P)-dependent oxidoreductase [Microlunatus antarcticus]|uniref:Probable oxidoreductase n=1 Tax=Microlunatus antarcticus TaxID=53388 RepID=A0A7W5JZP4_9ACTN|nr:SDR family NAD(P)-dependent oxidoreductase [Microlunatus antarcticus]MBB3329111.1 NAD(P)-dependent dehydrogenase (short-subunit alcohol dehydrogenase family) [Microlunatus antarcticus]